ncbi:MAG: diacylglycerol kinase [Burkholderiales bacterium]|nr:diacylglycerol kinase [Burkholderiales bacterium]
MSSPAKNPHKGRSGLNRIIWATLYSYQGLWAGLRHESAFRQEAALALVMLPAAFWLGQTWVEVALLVTAVVLVLIVELLNSGIEAVVDRVSMDLHELSKRAKDFGSAAVHLSLLLCGGVWACALYQRFLV